MSASSDPNRNADGTFKSNNQAGSTMADTAPVNTDMSSGLPADVDPSRNADGTFAAGSGKTNPDNFANKAKGDVQELAKEGGKASGGGQQHP
ncbi:hypothetical protein B0A50_01300 [Salinomyces thailandicus]|uniref:Uncharacterized protein n=1 Tax=Salinomyces thailandicus TaxID=706561 RepID=A0A4U0UA45_9PEZI|nr:hypothetical protein B0A50_01300 [Salinomyces thailandica]